MGLILQSLPDNDLPLRFRGITDLRESRAGPTQFSFQAEFYVNAKGWRSPHDIQHFYAWVNLAFLPMFTPDSDWRNREKIRDAPIKFKRNGSLMGSDFGRVVDLFAGQDPWTGGRSVEFKRTYGSTELSPNTHFNGGPYLYTAGPDALCIATSEVVRFYVSAFGSIFHELVAAFRDKTNFDPSLLLEGLVHLERSRWIDEETFLIAPKPGVIDRVSATQLALLMTDPELLRTVWFITRALTFQVNYAGEGALLATLPMDRNGGFDCELGHRIDFVATRENVRRMTPIRKIKRDRRKFAFSRLIIEVEDFAPASSFNGLATPSGEVLDAPLFGSDVEITELAFNSGVTRRLGDFGPSFSDCFPSVGQITLQMRAREGKASLRRRQVKIRRQQQAKAATLNAASSSDGIPGYQTADVSHLANVSTAPAETVEPRNLFPVTLPPGAVKVEYHSLSTLGQRLQTFCKVRSLMRQEGISEAIFPDEGSDAEPLIIPPKTWGPFAVSRKYGSRRMGAICIRSDAGPAFYALELGQLAPDEYVSMAVAMHKEGRPLTRDELHGILFVACQRGEASPTSSKSIWPTSYSDVVVEPIAHHARLQRPTMLRLAILSAINMMAGGNYSSWTLHFN